MLQGLKKLLRMLCRKSYILFPLSNFRAKYKNRRKCFFNGRGSIIQNTVFQGRNMIGKHVTLVNCEIGFATYINHGSRLIGSKIGRYCSIADNVYSGFGHHPLKCISTHSSFFYDTTSQLGWSWYENGDAPIYDPYKHPKDEDRYVSKIGHDVWIGSHVMIMDGVTIGTGAVVGTGSVVTTDVPPYAIVAGVPARIIRYRHPSDKIQELLDSEWWNMEFDRLKQQINTFSVGDIDFNSHPEK